MLRIFEDARYTQLAEQLHDEYARAEPFPHIAIDDFLPVEICAELLDNFPDAQQIKWLRFERHHSKKLATQEDSELSPFIRDLLAEMNSAACLRFLQKLTGIDGLLGDPYFEGGGLHQIEPGGFLKIHADFNFHKRLRLDRRINLIVYLNKDWKDEYNGHLQLWDRNMQGCVRKILPVFNRCVVFSTTDWSYHGHPDRLQCPEDKTRKSMALYYYTNGRPEEEKSMDHGTMWQEQPSTVGRLRQVITGSLRGLAAVLESPGKLIRKAAAQTLRQAK
jgi:Rps23 Pro-64 3,4-dihydroxylase Tpa1-like proline 4-hydroxylase